MLFVQYLQYSFSSKVCKLWYPAHPGLLANCEAKLLPTTDDPSLLQPRSGAKLKYWRFPFSSCGCARPQTASQVPRPWKKARAGTMKLPKAFLNLQSLQYTQEIGSGKSEETGLTGYFRAERADLFPCNRCFCVVLSVSGVLQLAYLGTTGCSLRAVTCNCFRLSLWLIQYTPY